MANKTEKITFKGNYLYVKGDQDMVLEGIYDSSDMKLMGGALYAFTRDDLKNFVAPDNTLQITHSVDDDAFNYMCSFTKIEAHMMSANGLPGPVGPTGPQGPAGPTGAAGKDGAPGKDGAAGPAGPEGPAGKTGAAGSRGEKGVAGMAATITVGTVKAGPKAAVVNTGSENAATFDFTLPRGEKGDKGDQGLRGEKGDTGTNGLDATIAVGEVTSGPDASVTNSGTANAAVFDFVLPKGPKGDAGKDGSNGLPGTAAGVGAPEVVTTEVDKVGTPTVTVTADGPDTAKVFHFTFANLKGETGADGKDAVINNATVVPQENVTSPENFYSNDGYVKASEVMKLIKAYCDVNCAPTVPKEA